MCKHGISSHLYKIIKVWTIIDNKNFYIPSSIYKDVTYARRFWNTYKDVYIKPPVPLSLLHPFF
ncbi:hypothetical protein Hanom_Chr07g00655691 [Helianthus anomalus]